MNTRSRQHEHTISALRARRGSARPRRNSTRRPRPQLIADAVVASYIHEISVRHRRRPGAMEPTSATS